MTDNQQADEPAHDTLPSIVGDVVFGGPDSPVAVCTLGSRTLLAALAGLPEIAVAGRVFTENVGIELMVQNLSRLPSVRFLIVCGRETTHRVGQTIVALHRHGLDATRRVVGSEAPEPIMPGLTQDQLQHFQERVGVIDMIGETDVSVILGRATTLAEAPVSQSADPTSSAPPEPDDVEVVAATRNPASAWEYDPVGYFLVFVDRDHARLRVEHRTQEHALARIYEGRDADALCHTILRRDSVTVLAHAAYLGRELARAETALALGLTYEQDRPVSGAPHRQRLAAGDQKEADL